MRVIAGRAKGRALFAPRGAPTRPTSDLVRGAVFDLLDAAGADLSAVLDLYAGSGAMGIEALSRGGGSCDFVERDPRACRAIRRNLRATGLESGARVWCRAARAALDQLTGPYTLVLADPPYSDPQALATLARCASGDRLTESVMLIFEHQKRTEAPPTLGPLRRLRERRHGDTVVSVYGHQAGHPASGRIGGNARKGTPP